LVLVATVGAGPETVRTPIQGCDLIKPIPVLIESLGDKVFVAEAPT